MSSSGAEAEKTSSGGRWGRWARRGSAALADQGLFAGSNFLLNVLLARWLSAGDYGAFSVVFAGFLLLATFHTATFTEPMLVFGSGKYAADFRGYLGVLVRLHWIGSILVAVLLFASAGIAALAGSAVLVGPLLALAPVGPLILLTWLVRRACYARMRPEDAVVGGIAYLLAMVAALVFLRDTGSLDPTTGILAMGGASIASLAVLMARLRLGPLGRRDIEPEERGSVVRDHWEYGRWALGTAVLTWVPSNLFVLVLPVKGGLEAGGAFRALINLLVPMMHASSALGILALPVLVRSAARGPDAHFRFGGRLAIAFGAGAVLYGAAIVTWGPTVLDWLYEGRYTGFSSALVVLAAAPVFAAMASALGSAVRAAERPDLVFYAYAVTAVVAATAGVALTLRLEVAGASAAWALTYSTAAVALGAVFVRWRRRHHESAR